MTRDNAHSTRSSGRRRAASNDHKIPDVPSASRKPDATDASFRSLADNMLNLAWMADADGWIYWYNTRWYEYTGTTAKSMEGWGWQSVHDTEQLPRVLERWQGSINTGEPFEMVFPLRGADDIFRPFLTQVVPIKNQEGVITQWFGTNTDISEQVADRKKVLELGSQIAEVFESMGDAFIMLDEDWNIMMVNKNQEEVSHTLRRDTIGKNFWKVFPASAAPSSKYWIYYHKVRDSKKPAHFVEYFEPLDVWTEVDVYPTKQGGISVFFRDISKRKQAEESLAASEARFRFVAETMPQQVWTATPAGQLDYVNKRTAEYFGKTVDEVIGDGWQKVLHPEDLEPTIEAWTRSLKSGETYETEFRLKRGDDNSYRWHLARARPMYDESGSIIKWFGSNTDIEEFRSTTQRRDELEKLTIALRDHSAQLEALNQSKDEFISLASHQLRTPATGVKQYVGMLLEGYAGELTEDQLRFLGRAYESNERQLKILNDLLKVASVDAGKVILKLAPVSLVPLLEEIYAEQETLFTEKNQTVSINHIGGDYTAIADKDLLRMILENLIDNARKYTHDGKRITITLSKPSNTLVKISVKDQGVGIAPGDIGKLGEKFTRLDNPLSAQVGGTGLGLYWVKKVMALHGGKLEIVSHPDLGSTFSIILKRS